MIFEAAHQMALLPLVSLAIVLALGRVPARDSALLGVAFSMSWIGDSLASFNEGSFSYGYLWAPAQLVLAYAAIVGTWSLRRVGVLAAACSMALLAYGFNPSKEVLLWTVGGLGLLLLVRIDSPLEAPILIYFGVGTVAFLLMINTINQPYFMNLWIFYQACRATALVWLSTLILAPQKELAHVVHN